MNTTTVQFGDIFLHNSQEYVFLAQRDEIIYTAKILDEKKEIKLKSYVNVN